jgi:starch synthase
MKKIKVALIRGCFLNPWEMMRYEPLREQFNITAMGTHRPLFDISGIGLDIRKFHWPGELFYVLGRSPAVLINKGLYKYFRYNQWMLGLEKSLAGFDVIHSADTQHLFSLQAARAKKKSGAKLVLTVWENIPFLDEKRGILRHISREVIDNTDVFLPVTNKSKEMLLIEGIPEEKIVVIPQPVDLQKFKPQAKNSNLLAKLGCAKGQPVILFIGRLHKTKGVEFLLLALKRLLQDESVGNLSPRVLIVGTGKQEKSLKKLTEKLGITQNVIMCGEVRHQELVEYYAAADIFALPSIPAEGWQEQFGMVLIEAMACGKPVVSTLSGSIPDVVGDAGFLIQPSDFYSLYAALKRLIVNPGLIAQYGHKARQRAEGVFNQTKIAEETAGIYISLVKDKG